MVGKNEEKTELKNSQEAKSMERKMHFQLDFLLHPIEKQRIAIKVYRSTESQYKISFLFKRKINFVDLRVLCNKICLALVL